jgi:hypothetical protein
VMLLKSILLVMGVIYNLTLVIGALLTLSRQAPFSRPVQSARLYFEAARSWVSWAGSNLIALLPVASALERKFLESHQP